MIQEKVSTPTQDALPAIPDLWVLSVVTASNFGDVATLVSITQVARQRVVMTSMGPTHLFTSGAFRVPGARVTSDLWNAGLSVIQDKAGADEWDVLMIDPAGASMFTPTLLPKAVASLRNHMRMLDTGMAEPDLSHGFHGNYRKTSERLLTIPEPPVVVVAGEVGMRFDGRIYDESDAWSDYCGRVRAEFGSVLVSKRGMCS